MKRIFILISFVLLSLSLVGCKTKKQDEFKTDYDYFVGIQDHFYDVRPVVESTLKTDYISDMTKIMNVKVFRLNVTMDSLFYVAKGDEVRFNKSTKDEMRVIVDSLKEAGVEKIVYANDSFIYPYGYSKTHAICVPDPLSETDSYMRWLTVNSIGYGMIAKEFPEICFFEPINEPDMPNGEVLCKNGMMWGTNDSDYMYSNMDEAHILADLMYYMRKEIRKSNSNAKMLTPGLTSLNTTYDYLECMYKAIESGCHPSGDLKCSVDPDDYFDIVALHPYSFVSENMDPLTSKEENITLINENYKLACEKFYEICVKHGDKEKRHWYTEIGYTDSGNGLAEEVTARELTKQLNLIKNELPFVECVIIYRLSDVYETKISITEDHFGMFRALSEPDNPAEPKPIAFALYSFTHNGTTDYSELYSLRDKYVR